MGDEILSKGLYLDTNIIFGWFDRSVERARKGKPFKEPSRLKFLKSKGFSLYVSIVTRTELFIRLKKKWNVTPKEFSNLESLWNLFRSIYRITELIPGIPPQEHISMTDIYSTVKHSLSIKTKVTKNIFGVIDFMHFHIAKINDLVYLTAERKLNESMLKKMNELSTVITWGKFRRLLR